MTWAYDSLGMGLFIGLAVPVVFLMILGTAMVIEAVKLWWEYRHRDK